MFLHVMWYAFLSLMNGTQIIISGSSVNVSALKF